MQNVASPPSAANCYLSLAWGSSSLYEGVSVLAELVEVMPHSVRRWVDPLFGQAQCLGSILHVADAADFHRAHSPSLRARQMLMTAGSDIANGRASLLTDSVLGSAGPKSTPGRIGERLKSQVEPTLLYKLCLSIALVNT